MARIVVIHANRLINKEEFSQKRELPERKSRTESPKRQIAEGGRRKKNLLKEAKTKQLTPGATKEVVAYTKGSKAYAKRKKLATKGSISQRIRRRDEKKKKLYEKLKREGAVYKKRLY